MSISLPELEVLGYLLDVPIDRFWDREPEIEPREPRPDLRLVMTLRHRIVGACLRRARLRAEMTQEELAEALGCSPKRVSDYERAEVPIPITELERVARFLNVPMEHFLDGQEGPVGEWHRQRVIDRRLQELPAEIQDFVAMPVNIKYLQVAMRLAEMSASRLRGIAEGLLEITY
jgi:transcriptional regulator with XRE-family HTH domain